MNREAVALGTPAYTMFAGRLGAVDEKLIADGRLRRAYSADDVQVKKKSRHTRRTPSRATRRCSSTRSSPSPGAAGPRARPRRWYDCRMGVGGRRPSRLRTALQATRGVRVRDRLFVSRHRIWQIVTDATLASAALYLAYLLRFNFDVPGGYVHQFLWIWPFVVGAELLCFLVLGLYNKCWRYSGVRDLVSVVLATVFGSAVGMVVGVIVAAKLQSDIYGRWGNELTADRIPPSVIVLNWCLLFLFMGGARLISRMYWERPWRHELSRDRKKVLVVGAGDAGELVVREMLKSQQIRYRPVGFIDDDPRKKNLRIHNVRVVGTTRRLPQLIDEYSVEEVIIAMPSVSGRVIEQIAIVVQEGQRRRSRRCPASTSSSRAR